MALIAFAGHGLPIAIDIHPQLERGKHRVLRIEAAVVVGIEPRQAQAPPCRRCARLHELVGADGAVVVETDHQRRGVRAEPLRVLKEVIAVDVDPARAGRLARVARDVQRQGLEALRQPVGCWLRAAVLMRIGERCVAGRFGIQARLLALLEHGLRFPRRRRRRRS